MDVVQSQRAKMAKEVPTKPNSGTRRALFDRFRRRRSTSAPPTTGQRTRLLEEHYRVDPENKRVVLPGVPKHEDDDARDMHDFFNLVFLVSSWMNQLTSALFTTFYGRERPWTNESTPDSSGCA